MEAETILVVDDNKEIVYSISELLKYEGYQVVKAYDGMEALEALEREKIDLILLDVMMPRLNGLSALMKLREKSKIPVIILSAKTEESDKVSGLVLGADDYVTKPFKAGVLLSRIRAVLRRRQQPQEPGEVLRCGDILLDRQKTAVTVSGKEVALTAGEFRLLAYLMTNKNRTVTRGSLLAHFWDCEGDFVNDNTLTVTVKRLREKLGENSRRMLKTVRGIGYQMEDIDD